MMSDVRQAWRMIGRMPGLAAVVIVSLGIGIGVNTAVFSWIQAMVLQPIPGVADAASFQLVESRADTGSYPGASWLEYRDMRDRLRTLPDLFAFRMVPFNVGEAGRPERTHGLLVSGNYFSALGLRRQPVARTRYLLHLAREGDVLGADAGEDRPGLAGIHALNPRAAHLAVHP